jgi:glycosyltransferase involved in cell wall biosynthesis
MPEKTRKPELTVLVPAYNEEQNIAHTIYEVEKYVTNLPFNTEVLVICDGCQDKTYEIATKTAGPLTKTINYFPNQGKGYALKYGFNQSQGENLIFFDAGLDFPPHEINKFYQKLHETNSDIVIGSKRHPDSQVVYPLKRKIISKCGQIVTKTLFNLNVKDTQVGLKIFRRNVLETILPQMSINGYAFDIELLALAQHYRFKITEAPIKLDFNFRNSSVSPKTIAKTFTDSLKIFYHLKIQKNNQIHNKNKKQS